MAEYWPAILALVGVSAVGLFFLRLGRALREEDREESEKVEREERETKREPVGSGRR